jgi:tetratricopeptide (TPR) repeat protein
MSGSDSNQGRVRLGALLILLATTLAYSNSFHGPFILDDHAAVTDNPTIRTLWPPGQALSPRPGTAAVEGRPLVNFSLAINYAIGGLDVRGYHATNLAIHILAGLVLFGVVRRTLALRPAHASAVAPAKEEGSGSPLQVEAGVAPGPPHDGIHADMGRARCHPRRFAKPVQPAANAGALAIHATGIAFTIALLWTLHPLQTESVTYIVQRAEALGGLTYLFALYAVLRGENSSHPRWWYLASVAACAVGAGCKEILLTAPVVVLLFDRIFLSTSWRQVLGKSGLFYLGLAASWLILGILKVTQHGVYVEGMPQTEQIQPTLELLWQPAALLNYLRVKLWADVTCTPWTYLLTQPGVILHYLRLALWPDHLCLSYNWPFATSIAAVWPQATAILAMLALTAWALLRHPRWGFLGVWFFIILAPSSSILPIQDAAFEHRLYLPLAAVIIALVIPAAHLAAPHPRARRALAILAAAIALALGARTYTRNHDYRSALAIWDNALRQRPNNPAALHARGAAYANLGQYDRATADLNALLALEPENADAHASLADVFVHLGDPQSAMRHFARAVSIRPGTFNAQIGLANLLLMDGQAEAAIERAQLAVQMRPDRAEGHSALGIALCSRGRIGEGLPYLQEAARLNPQHAETRNNLGRALALLGRLPEAEAELAEAIRLNPGYADAIRNLNAIRQEPRP